MFAALAAQHAVERITAENLADLLKTRGGNEIVLVDCREDDYNEGGHIRGSTNVPAEDFDDDDNVQELVQRIFVDGNAHTIVFYCAKSQHRGPNCARRFRNQLDVDDDREGACATEALPQVFVLDGGFDGFCKHASCAVWLEDGKAGAGAHEQ